MSDEEIARMAAFGVRSCASRIQQLARESTSPGLTQDLMAIAAELLECEAGLRGHTARGRTRRGAREDSSRE